MARKMSEVSSAVVPYLETLSHNELIKLLHSFAITHEDIRKQKIAVSVSSMRKSCQL